MNTILALNARRVRCVPGCAGAGPAAWCRGRACLQVRPAASCSSARSSTQCWSYDPCQVSEADYPYVSGTTTNDEDCQYDLASVSPVASITGYNNLPPNDQDAIMAHLANVSFAQNLDFQ